MAGISYSGSLPEPSTSSLLTTNQSGMDKPKKGGTFAKWWLSQQIKPQKIRGTFISVATREFRQPGRKCFCRLSSSPSSPLPVSFLGPSLELSMRGKESTSTGSSITWWGLGNILPTTLRHNYSGLPCSLYTSFFAKPAMYSWGIPLPLTLYHLVSPKMLPQFMGSRSKRDSSFFIKSAAFRI